MADFTPRTALHESDFDGWAALADHAASAGHGVGAAVSFVGTMRDHNAGDQVTELSLEHYPGMTDAALASLAEQAAERWPLQGLLLRHRVGRVLPGQTLVVIGVWSAHRAAAFAACEWLIERLKQDVPLWKHELTDAGPRWVAGNTPGRAL